MPEDSLIEQLDQAIDALLGGAAPPAPADSGLARLLDVCDRLRDLPDENFKTRLKNELQRRASMAATTPAYRREGFRTVTPYIMVPDAGRIVDFVKATFGAEELVRHPTPGGFHAELRLGDSMLMMGGGDALRGRSRTAACHVYVPDCDTVFRRAIDAGGTSLGDPADRPYGERAGFVRDSAGNYWYIATRLAGHYAPENLGDVLPFLHPESAAKLVDFLERAFGAQELQRFEHEGRVMHTAVRIGDAVIEMGEPEDRRGLPENAFYLYVEDADAVYRRALAAGATSLFPPADQPYGDRTGGIQDPAGYQWFPATRLARRTG